MNTFYETGSFRKVRRLLIATGILLLAVITFSFAYSWYLANDSLKQKMFASQFHEKEAIAEKALGNMSKAYTNSGKCFFDLGLEQYSSEGMFFYCMIGDSLSYWSSSDVPIDKALIFSSESGSTISLKNGYYFLKKQDVEGRQLLSLIGIYHDYKYQNEYLQKTFFEDFPFGNKVSFSPKPGSNNIYSSDGSFVGSLVFHDSRKASGWTLYLILALFLAFILVLEKMLFHAYETFSFIRKRRMLLFFLFVVDVLIIRLLISWIEAPRILFTSDLFDPYGFSSSILNPSIGDAIINVFMLLMVSWLFYSQISIRYEPGKTNLRVLGTGLLLLAVFLIFRMLTDFIHNLVLNSSFSFNLQSIYSLDLQSLMGIILISTAVLSFVFITLKLLFVISKTLQDRTNYFVLMLFFAVPFSLIEIFFFGQHYTQYLFLLLLILAIPFVYDKGKLNLNFSAIIFLVLLHALMLNTILNRDNAIKERQYRKLILSELSMERDPWLEFEFSPISEEIARDTLLLEMALNEEQPAEVSALIENYLSDRYLDPFLSKYKAQVTICREGDVLEIQPQGYLIECREYFESVISTMGEATLAEGLYFLRDEIESNNYLAVFYFDGENGYQTALFIELYSRIIPEEGLGYPDLLLDKESNFISNLSDYSYARYRNGYLTYKFGEYPYTVDLSGIVQDEVEETFLTFNGFSHLIKQVSDNNYLIISLEKPDLLQKTAPFSFLFIAFVIYLLFFTLFTLLPGGFRQLDFYFRDRLQLAVIAIILVSFIVIGIVSRIYIIKLNEDKNSEVLKEKTLSVLIELEHKVADFSDIYDAGENYLSDILYKFSLVFFSDINLYDTNGQLIVSSRPEIFEAGLMSIKMNPEAYSALHRQGLLEFLHTEHIGKQSYLSSYMQFRNNEGVVTAYLNLPYFSKQRDLQSEIASFLIAYINIYILTIIFTILTTLIVAKYVTRPLELIRNKMRNIRLGDPDAKIAWKHEDEIGALVSEYNRMLDVIAESAEKIARSERETAWREMAQQVAHEIKNPLTPMRLNVQYLKKSWDEKLPGWEKKFEKFTRNMIEQIDSLSEIASAFSDFAKMPGASIDTIDLKELTSQAAELYEDSTGITFTFSAGKEGPFMIRADRKQLMRVLNNLIRNSIQATSGKKDGRIDIRLYSEEGNHILEISDNGTGIEPAQAEKIFRPSFTTKSGGMGLGLAIVHNIVKNSGGEIWFDSEPGEGTTFYVKFPEANQPARPTT